MRVCVCANACECVSVYALILKRCAFKRMCERLGPVRSRRSKYPSLLLRTKSTD